MIPPTPFAFPAPSIFVATFTSLDWAVLIGYFAVVLSLGTLTGLFAKIRGSKDYFLAARSMPMWAVAISILSTAQSAATFIGAPSQSYSGDLTYLSSNIGQVMAAVILAAVFIPIYYARNVTTPYELLETRFGPAARHAAAWTYLIGRIFASGSRVFIGSLPMSLVIFGDTQSEHMLISIAIVSVIGIAYAFLGGIRSVIWTDVLQVAVYVGSAALAIVFLLRNIDAAPGQIFAALGTPGTAGGMFEAAGTGGGSKLTVIRSGLFSGPGGTFGVNFAEEFTLLTAVTGFCLMGLASYGMDQDLVQRMLTCRNAKKGAWSVITGVLVGIPAVLVFMVIGLLLHIYYQRPDLTGAAHAPGGEEKVFLQFILDAMPSGLTGLMMAGLFAAGMAPLSSMSSAFVSDIYRTAPLRANRSDRHYLRVGRAGVVVFGVLLGLFAMVCVFWFDPKKSTLLTFALQVMTFAYAGLLGVFFVALFAPKSRGNSASAIAALITGFVVVLLTEPRVISGVQARFDADAAPFILAFPWRLTLGAGASFLVCLAGNGTERSQRLQRSVAEHAERR